MITRRCTQRQFLLRPDEETNNAFLYCLIEAAIRCRIDLLMTCAMSNHHHTIIHDRYGRYPEFIEHFHKLFARSQNALRGRWENLWASHPTSAVQLATREAVIDKVVYAATNPVIDGLVERVHHWPGVNGLKALVTGGTLRATRPRHFFRADGSMPEEVELALSVPGALGPADEFVNDVKLAVGRVETEMAAKRRMTGSRVLGRRTVLKQAWWQTPTTSEPRRGLRPQVAARSAWARIEALLRNKAFQRAYAQARASWLAGLDAVFPVGTYWLRRFANVPIVAD